MAIYMVERSLPGITPEQLTAAAGRAKSVSAEMTAGGTAVRYLRSTFVPEGDQCFCLFEANAIEAVTEAQRRAEIPFDRIVEAQHLAAEDLD